MFWEIISIIMQNLILSIHCAHILSVCFAQCRIPCSKTEVIIDIHFETYELFSYTCTCDQSDICIDQNIPEYPYSYAGCNKFFINRKHGFRRISPVVSNNITFMRALAICEEKIS